MFRYIWLVALLANLTTSVAAAQQQGPVIVSSSSGTPLIVNGLAPDKLPVTTSLGAEICLPTRQVYVSEGERFTFQNWSSGGNDTCIKPDKPGEYRALYSHEVLLVVKSDVQSAQKSMWAAFGVPVKLEVPPVVQDTDDSRYRFQSWSDGETPFQAANAIAPVKPATLQVNWVHEHLVTVEAPDGADIKGTGWYADGANLVLRAPDTLPGGSDQDRLKFTRWEGDGFPTAVLQNPTTTLSALKVDAAYTVKAVFTRQYLVDAGSPFGSLKHDWVNEGESVVLEAPATADIVPDQQRFVFKRWDGMDGLLSPKITGKVDKPISVTAVYDKQVKLTVNAPYGVSGDGWQQVGSVANITVPNSVAQMFLLNSTFVGFGGYPSGQASIQVLVNEPTTLTALYRTEPNLVVLALILLLPLVAVLVYLGVTRAWFIAWNARARQRIWISGSRRGLIAPEIPERNGTHLPAPIGDQQRN
ncbi:MAG: hypothetical protein J2P17_09455 [Mycobacterium sp.]|nr:hypothetical protein [Mycobacterium sp.]